MKDLQFIGLTVVNDAIKVEFGHTKSDQTGDNLNPKHCFSNPDEPWCDFNLALAVCLACGNELDEGQRHVFTGGVGAATTFNKNIKTTLDTHADEVDMFGGLNFSTHSWRKGSATAAQSGTTCGSSTPSFMHRGDWTMGVLDRYFKFADAGDHYIGRLMAMMDPHSTRFGVLPPHFRDLSAAERER